MTWGIFFAAIISSMLIENVVLYKFLGVCPFLGVSKKTEAAFGMSVAVLFVMMIAALVTFPLYYLVLAKLDIAYIQTISFILIIASLVQLVEMFIKKTSKKLYKSLGIYLPLITTNCAILGIAVSNITSDYAGEFGFGTGYFMAMTVTFGTALGFGLIMFTFSSIRERLDGLNIPAAWKGVPISLVIAGIMALALAGLGGVV